jgi:small subunit ribosomal protein S16
MAVKIRLARAGKIHAPFYHIVVADERKARDGRFIEILGTYDPRNKKQRVAVKKERVEHWMKQGAKTTETVAKLVRSL